MSNLPDLPANNHSFWNGAEKFVSDNLESKKCDHYFIKKDAIFECNKCHIGFLVTYPFYVLDGKICVGDELAMG